MKTIEEIAKSFLERYNKYAEDLKEFNEEFHRLAKETMEILTFMEATKKAKEGLEE